MSRRRDDHREQRAAARNDGEVEEAAWTVTTAPAQCPAHQAMRPSHRPAREGEGEKRADHGQRLDERSLARSPMASNGRDPSQYLSSAKDRKMKLGIASSRPRAPTAGVRITRAGTIGHPGLPMLVQ